MICYRDRTFCSRALEDCSCDDSRKLTKEVLEAAKRWWGEGEPPICVSDLCGGKNDNNRI